jgi:photosystem II stability/assembly factor-like uncharacterized protein
MKSTFSSLLALLLAAAGGATAQSAAPADGAALHAVPAALSAMASHAMILGSTLAGSRLVGVGEHGVVLLSDDGGKTVRQARSVPVSSTLNEVSFVDDRHGWAVGHWGVILATEDGGETWQVQRLSTQEDRPLFSVRFQDAQHGVAVGLWSLVLTTEDGGKTWATRELAPPAGARKADANLLHLFGASDGTLYAAAERGLVLRSRDRGATWDYLVTGYKGSFWSGVALADGTLLVGGQRGVIYRSADAGSHWDRVELDSKSSITSMASREQQVLAVGLDGLVASSGDDGRSFKPKVREDKLPLTSVLSLPGGGWAIWSREGLASDKAPGGA